MTLFSGVTYLSSYAPNFYIFCVLYGAIPPFCVGLLYLLPIHCGWAYFPKKKGMVTGIIVSSFAFANTAFGIISTWIVNPDNLKPTIIIYEGD